MIKKLLKKIAKDFSEEYHLKCITHHYKRGECSCCYTPQYDILISLNGAKNEYGLRTRIKGDKIIDDIMVSFAYSLVDKVKELQNLLESVGFTTEWEGTSLYKLRIIKFNKNKNE